MPYLMFHDDGCGQFLNKEGECPKCEFHPDMQSIGFKYISENELDRQVQNGLTFLGKFRMPIERKP